MKKIKSVIIVSILMVLLAIGASGCGTVVRTFGGTEKLDLPIGQKFVNASWKEKDLWYITKPMTKDGIAETYTYTCSSNFGIIQGTVIIVEPK